MNTSKNTILITGGGSGIGFETAKLFSKLGNTVILTGRSEEKLRSAIHLMDNAHYIAGDITTDADVNRLVKQVYTDFPGLNILMNNAGRAILHNVSDSTEAAAIAREEMETNFFATVNLTTKFLPLLKNQHESAIINVSSIVAFAPGLTLPTYSASKAALHSYTQALRLSLRDELNLKVFELMPPLVDTEFAKDIPSDKKISPQQVAADLIQSIQTNQYEIRVASADMLYKNFLNQSDKAVLAINGLDLN
jgi:uncharacterized oxidoreductase